MVPELRNAIAIARKDTAEGYRALRREISPAFARMMWRRWKLKEREASAFHFFGTTLH